MDILSFGHIPSSEGGRQSSGLANVIYKLAYNCAKHDNVNMTLSTTDVFVPKLQKDNLTIMGWTKEILLKHAFMHPFVFLKIMVNTFINKARYSHLESVPRMVFKKLFLDYSIKKNRPQVVHMHGALSILYLPIIPSDIKVVVTLHGNIGNDINIPNHSLYARLERLLVKSNRIDTLCLIAKMLKTIFSEEYGNIKPVTKIILNAYDNSVFKYIEKRKHKKITLCTIASYSERKGQDRVVEALISSNCDYRYLCIGHISDDDLNKLKDKTQKLDFEWLGVKKPKDIPGILAECDYMILPSSSEGFGLVYLEAIACGVPVIIPKHLPLAMEENILNNSNSIKIEDSSSDAIKRVLPALQGREWERKKVASSVISYTWENIAEEYVELYASLIQK